MKRIAALTMVRNDDFYLRKWVEYYGAQLGMANLYIYFDGRDQVIPDFCAGTHACAVDKIGNNVVENDRLRLHYLSERAAERFREGYDLVIGTDADEFIVVDPDLGLTLEEYLSAQSIRDSLSPLGLDFGQKLGEEPAITPDLPFLRQRHYALIGPRYTKASILARPLTWGSGFHRVKGHNFHIAKDLYLFHFGYFDRGRIVARFKDGDRAEQGWKHHIAKRSRTIRLVTRRRARDFGRWTRFARWMQSWCRPPYAWNKPAMLEMKIVVRIPDRFKDLV